MPQPPNTHSNLQGKNMQSHPPLLYTGTTTKGKKFILDMNEDNGRDRKSLEKIADDYLPKDQREKQAPDNLFPIHNDSKHSSNVNGNNGSSARNNNDDE